MKKWLNTKGLKFKLWTYFGLFAAAIMLVLWLLQIIFLRTYYEGMKVAQIEKIGSTIISKYEDSNFEDLIYQISYKNGIVIRIFDSNAKPILNSNFFGGFRAPRVEQSDLHLFINKISSSHNKRISYTINDEGLRAHVVVYGAEIENKIGEKVYLYINAPLAPVDATSKVLQNQLMIVTAISLLLAFYLSYFIARRLAGPIVKITRCASRLAKGQYNVVFEEGGYTEIDQLASVLNKAAKELSITDTLRRDLIANVSHDLRTPLTIVKSYAEMIRDISGDNPEKRNAHTQVIVEEVNRLSMLVSDMLDLSKMESGTVILNKHAFDLSCTLRLILNRFEGLSQYEGYHFDVQCQGALMVNADEQKIEQVIYNLLSNAVHFTGEDKRVIISITGEFGKARFSVTDTGEGIAQKDMERIWERYYQASKTHKRQSYGTGIGLSIVRSILEAHGAAYGVQSLPGEGATFWFELDKEE